MIRWTSAVRFAVAISAALVMAGFLTACENSPTGPTGPREPSITRVEIVGPRAVAPGETAQFSAIARLTNGSSRDVTPVASWSSGNSEVLSIAGPGLATGRERGDAEIGVTFDNAGQRRSSSKEVIVVPAGTYRLVGLVSEAGVSTEAVAGARVEVTTGVGAGLFTTTDSSGFYRLYGVSGETNIRVTKDGYQPQARTITVADHQTLNIELPLLGPRDDRSRTYTLTITASDVCRRGEGVLPEEARVRRYTAVVTQRGPELEVVLTGATFPNYGYSTDRFHGRVEPGGAVFSLEWWDEFYPRVMEQLTPSTVLALDGTVVATGPADRLAGMLDGSVQVSEGNIQNPFQRHIAWCSSASHQFLLTR